MTRLASGRFVPLAGAGLLLGLYIYYDLVVYRDYLLRGDEPAFVSANLGSPLEWFTRGYLDYFDTYPEWASRRTTDLLKPVTNMVGYLNLSLFGRTYALHYATFFLIQFAGLVVFVRLLRESAIPPLPAAFMALLFLFNPAFMNAGLTCLSCHFDVLAGVFALAAFLAAWRARYALTLLLLTLALFTKESAVFAPAAAALSLLLWRRRPSLAVLMLSPLVVWAAARFLAYGDVTGGRFEAPIAPIAAGLFVWPTGIVPSGFETQLASSFPATRTDIISAVFLLANVGLWVFIVYAALLTARREVLSPARTGLTASLLVWTLGALTFGVMMGHHARYGGSYYPFLYLFLAGFLFSPAYRVPRWTVASILLVFSAVTIVQAGRNARLAWTWQSFIAPERALHDALRTLPQDGRTVYVVNAPPGFASAPHHLNLAWSLDLNVVIVNQFDRCVTSPDAGTTRFLDAGEDMLLVQIPDCAVFMFGAVDLEVLRTGIRENLPRNGIGIYRFSDGIAQSARPLELGHALGLQVDPSGADPTVIGYNWNTASYSVIGRP